MAAAQAKPASNVGSRGYSRVHKDLKELHGSPTNDCPPMCAIPFDDTTNVLALVVGPPNTAYAFGFFLFLMSFDDYPASPPSVQLLTTNGGLTRFNPNLYADGKVCLSILGTWEGDESEMWQPSYTIANTLMAIQSMVMTDEPFRNEPGFEGYNVREKLKAYNAKVTHETIRLAVCDTMEAILERKPHYATEFAGVLKSQFLMYYSHYAGVCRAEQHRDGDRFEQTSFEWSSNQMAGQFDYTKLLLRLSLIKARLDGLHLSSLEATRVLSVNHHHRAAEILCQAAEVQRVLLQHPHRPCVDEADSLVAREGENYPCPVRTELRVLPQNFHEGTGPPLGATASTTTEGAGLGQRGVEILPVVHSDRGCLAPPDLQRVRQELETKMQQVQWELDVKQAEEGRLSMSKETSLVDGNSDVEDDDDDDELEDFFIEDMDRHGENVFSMDFAEFNDQISHMKQVGEQLREHKQQLLLQLAADSMDSGCRIHPAGPPTEEWPEVLATSLLDPEPALHKAHAIPMVPSADSAPLTEFVEGNEKGKGAAAASLGPPPVHCNGPAVDLCAATGDKWSLLAPCIQSVVPRHSSDVFWWRLTLRGDGVPGRQGALYDVDISLPADGMEFPRIQFATPIFHPNVSEEGDTWYPYASHYDGCVHSLADLVLSTVALFVEPLSTPTACLNPDAAALCFSSSRDDAMEYYQRVSLCAKASRGRALHSETEVRLLQRRYELEAASSRRLRRQCLAMQHEAYNAQKEIARKTELLKRTDTVIGELCRQTRLQKEMIEAQARVIREKDEIAAATHQLNTLHSSHLRSSPGAIPWSPVSTADSCDTSRTLDLAAPNPPLPSPSTDPPPACPRPPGVLPRVIGHLVVRVLAILLRRLTLGLEALTAVARAFRPPAQQPRDDPPS